MRCNMTRTQDVWAAQVLIWRNPLSCICVRVASENKHNSECAMMDVLMVALALLLFAAAIGYTYACERL
ncbi:MAG TPA: hypothetical protein VKY22_16230 [Bradyrhizobium sp.]|nr:hypothetical protein [Bradyrhizobium sp.]